MELTRLKTVFNAGGVIAYPTEACYGLGCDPNNRVAVENILRLKGRSVEKGLILIADQVARLDEYVRWPENGLMRDIQASWQAEASRATTWLLPVRTATPHWLSGEFETLAVRVTQHPVAKQLCAELGQALVSTSANPQGQAPALSAEAVYDYFNGSIELVVEGEIGQDPRPSRMIDAVSGNVIRT